MRRWSRRTTGAAQWGCGWALLVGLACGCAPGADEPVEGGAGWRDPPAPGAVCGVAPPDASDTSGGVTCGPSDEPTACVLRCSDDDPSTRDLVLPDGGCGWVPYPGAVTPAQACTADVACDGDGCAGQVVACRDGDPCTADLCDRPTGRCVHLPIPGCRRTPWPDPGSWSGLPDGVLCELGASRPKQRRAVRVVSYNVLQGLGGHVAGYEPDRRYRVSRWLTRLAPDVVALQELNGWSSDKLVERAVAWGHTHGAVAGNTSFRLGITSRAPLDEVTALPELTKFGALFARVDGLGFLVVHLDPLDPAARRAEGDAVRAFVAQQRARGVPVIVLGDFNDVSPADAAFHAVDGLAAWVGAHPGEAAGLKTLAAENMAAFAAAGLVDLVARHRTGQGPTPTLLGWNPPWGARIDYILAPPEVAARSLDAWVADSPVRRAWSDHLPVVVDLARQ